MVNTARELIVQHNDFDKKKLAKFWGEEILEGWFQYF